MGNHNKQTRTITGTNLDRLCVLRAWQESKPTDNSLQAVRGRRKVFRAMLEDPQGLDLTQITLNNGAVDKQVLEACFSLELDRADAQVWETTLTKWLDSRDAQGQPRSQGLQDGVLPILEQLAAFVAGEPPPLPALPVLPILKPEPRTE